MEYEGIVDEGGLQEKMGVGRMGTKGRCKEAAVWLGRGWGND